METLNKNSSVLIMVYIQSTTFLCYFSFFLYDSNYVFPTFFLIESWIKNKHVDFFLKTEVLKELKFRDMFVGIEDNNLTSWLKYSISMNLDFSIEILP